MVQLAYSKLQAFKSLLKKANKTVNSYAVNKKHLKTTRARAIYDTQVYTG